jgi:hypothetical protein
MQFYVDLKALRLISGRNDKEVLHPWILNWISTWGQGYFNPEKQKALEIKVQHTGKSYFTLMGNAVKIFQIDILNYQIDKWISSIGNYFYRLLIVNCKIFNKIYTALMGMKINSSVWNIFWKV